MAPRKKANWLRGCGQLMRFIRAIRISSGPSCMRISPRCLMSGVKIPILAAILIAVMEGRRCIGCRTAKRFSR